MKALYTSRRGFLLGTAAITGALALGVSTARADTTEFTPNVFVRIDTDGTLFLTCNRAEMGQGVRSSIPALIADELGADLGRVVVEQAPGDDAYGDQNTDGSTSIRSQYEMLRRMGAVARTLLVQAAARQLGVPASGLTTRNHHVTGGPRDVPFGDLVLTAAALEVPDPDRVTLRPDSELVYMGTTLPLVDGMAYITGTAEYGADKRLPGQVYAVVARPPSLGDELASVDDSATRRVRGVLDVVRLPEWSAPGRFHPLGGVAVVAETTWAAMAGRDALVLGWSRGKHAGVDSASEYAAMAASVDTDGNQRRGRGDADEALAAADTVHTAVYRIPHLVHAPMEPPAATVWVHDGRCEVWAPVQAPQRTRDWVKKVVDVDTEDIRVNVTYLGGGFGRKGKPDFVLEAAFLSQHMGLPVTVQWSREDDVRHSYYHACSVQRIDAAFDGTGALSVWRQRIASPSIATIFAPLIHGLQNSELQMGIFDLPLSAPNVSMQTHAVKDHLRIGWYRSVYNINHAFAIQSFIGELAHARGLSMPDMLKAVLGPPRLLTTDETGGPLPNYDSSLDEHPIDVGRWHRVIDRVRVASDYDAAAYEDSALGMAAHASFNSYVAVVVRVARDPRGGPLLREAWVSADVGRITNRDRVVAQFEGAVVFGATLARYGNITLDDGAVVQSNFRDYRLLRMHESPHHVHVDLVTEGEAPGGVGEPGVPPVAPAIANAWFNLTGERVRELPFQPGQLPT